MKEKICLDNEHQRVFAKALEDFSNTVHLEKEIPISLFHTFHQNQEKYLHEWHKKGGSGLEIAQKRSKLIDVLLKNLFEVIVHEKTDFFRNSYSAANCVVVHPTTSSTLLRCEPAAPGTSSTEERLERSLIKKFSKGLCIVAFGGYGRGEMNPFSDVDIMFLHEKNKKLFPQSTRAKILKNYFEQKLLTHLIEPNKDKEAGIEKIITSILMVLWDLGLKVGHATRSIEEAIQHANEEKVSKTAMLEARFVAGEEKIFHKFKEKFRKKCLLGQEEAYIQWRLENIKKTQEKFGKNVFIQEPNIKSGRGGLRDYQNLLWISLACGGDANHSYWTSKKFLRLSEQKKLTEAYHFLLRVRNEMHYQEKRANDQLTLRLQGVVATELRYPQRTILRRSEAFMKDYYQQTREMHLITTAVLERMAQVNKRPTLLSSLFEIKKREKKDGFLIKEKRLFPQNREIFKDPARLMRAFYLAQTQSLEFSSELNDLIKKQLSLVDRAFRYSKEIRGIFLNILSRKGEVGRILRMMHDLGFLGKYLPEFGVLTCLVQHEFFHRYTADEHTLVCIEKIDELLFTKEIKLQRYRTIFKNIDDVAMLYLGMLLHDTGKAANVLSHAEASTVAAEKVARRFQLSKERQDLLLTLVEAHGELATVARTRDLDDFTAVYQFATVVKNLPTLDELMILTLADGMGTSDGNWSDWKEQLVWNLYNQTKRYFEIGKNFSQGDQRGRAGIKKEVKDSLSDDFREEIEAHFEQMPERYLRMMTSPQITEHLRLFRSFFEHLKSDKGNPLEAQIRWIELPEAGHTEFWICGWDRKRLLERIAAAFLKAEINILSADIFTRRDYLTLDIFRVTSVRSDPLLTRKEKKMVEECLKNYLENNNFLTVNEPIKSQIPLARIFHSNSVKACENLMNTTLGSNFSSGADAQPLYSCQGENGENHHHLFLHHDSQRLATNQHEICKLEKMDSSENSIFTNVSIDNQSHPTYTVVKIETQDRQGLFYNLLGALNYEEISIDLACIATEMKAAFDAFYILDREKKKVTDQEILNTLKERLVAAIT